MNFTYSINLNSITVGLLAIIVVLFYSWLIRRWSRAANKGQLAPEPKGAWPILGHLPLLGGSTPAHKTLGAMADKYGPIFTIRLGVFPSLVVSSSEIAKECFTTNDRDVASRPKVLAAEHLGYNYALFGFAPSGPYWREIRKITTLEFLSNRRVELLKHIRVSEVSTLLKELHQTYCSFSSSEKKKGGSDEGVLVELKQWFEDMTLNVILRMVAGKHYSVTTDVKEKEEARRVHNALRNLFILTGQFVLGDAVPWLRWLDLGGHEKVMKKTRKELDAIVGKWLEEHKQKSAAGDAKGEHDFMYALLDVLQGADLEGFDADTVNKATSLTMIAGGSDTTMVTLTWAISLLLNNPHVLKRAQDELDTQIGRERVVKESDISKLVNIQAIVKETLRLYPAAPLSVPHLSTEDCTIGGYHVPKGTRLITNLSKIHTDPKVWPDPFEFKPERFLTTHKDVDVKGQHFELIPFGSGRRACPGLSFGLQMVQFALASFLHGFQIWTPSNAPVDVTESFGVTNVKATPLQVLIKPRLPSELYG